MTPEILQTKSVSHRLILILVLLFASLMPTSKVIAQTAIPYGLSLDSIRVSDYASTLHAYQSFFIFKPTTYDSLTSPILIAIHGSWVDGSYAIGDLDSIAYRRKALIIAPNLGGYSFSAITGLQEPITKVFDTINLCLTFGPATVTLKKIYDFISLQENRTNIPAYMIGFSAGGQFVTRYMLMRQAYPDSIPIKMAVSSNAYYYAFPVDTLMGVAMPWLCGLIMPDSTYSFYCINSINMYDFNCNEDIVQYYNENYGVLIGTGDVQQLNDNACAMVQGNNRYERAFNFYNFCDSNAVTRGTTLQWQYEEVPGVGHDQHAMYNNKVNPNDTSSIAETLLFDTPYHTVPSISTVASFYADTTLINVNDTVHFINTSYLATSYLWDFGDSITSNATNPWHVYTTAGTKTVQLTAMNNTGCNNWTEKRHYIKVQAPTGFNVINASGLQVNVYPNPATDFLSIDFLNKTGKKLTFTLFNLLGEEEKQISFTETTKFDVRNVAPGIYFYKVMDGQTIVGVGKVIKL